MLWYLSDKDRLTALVTLLLPVSLLLGFLLNTVVWVSVNPAKKTHARAEVDKRFVGLRDVIARVRDSELSELRTDAPDAKPWPRESFEYYFLCSVEVERLAHLWESYFSWYEFHINSAFAIPLFAGSTALYAGLSFFGAGPLVGHCLLAGATVLVSVATGVACLVGLSKSATRNLVEYEKGLLLLIAGSLRKTEKPGAPAPAKTGS